MKLFGQSYVKYGLLMCAVVVVCLTVMELTGQNQSFDKSPLTIVWTFIAPAVVWYLGINARKKSQKGKLTFKEGVKEGFKISFVFGLVSPFIFALYYLLFNPQILEYVKTSYGLTNAEDAIVIAVDMLVQFISALIFGTIYAAIISFFLKTKTK
jgi:FtsH-binding integral membrane protein